MHANTIRHKCHLRTGVVPLWMYACMYMGKDMQLGTPQKRCCWRTQARAHYWLHSCVSCMHAWLSCPCVCADIQCWTSAHTHCTWTWAAPLCIYLRIYVCQYMQGRTSDENGTQVKSNLHHVYVRTYVGMQANMHTDAKQKFRQECCTWKWAATLVCACECVGVRVYIYTCIYTHTKERAHACIYTCRTLKRGVVNVLERPQYVCTFVNVYL